MLEYVITFIIFIFAIIVVILCLQKSYGGGNENHWLNEPMNKKVKNSLLLYVNTSLKSIITKKPSILRVFKHCIENTRNRKSDLVQLRKKLLQTKLGNSNAGRNETWRSASRTKNLEWILNNLSDGKTETLKGPYLDIGCGDGSITASVYTNLITNNKSKSDVICLEHGDEHPGFNALVTRETDITNLKPNYFNTISAFMSLHHIPTIEAMMDDIDRISRIGSIFVMRDHDFTYCVSNFDSKRDARQFLDWVHVLYYLAESGDNSNSNSIDWLYDTPRTDIVYQYQPMSYWDGLLNKIGFKRISNRGSKKSLICSYYAVYKKIG
jgi:2-polyprenyl-3-methyl-5-hydroxy-6-metoxy-1,4-benzoquinol methylase